MKDPQLQECLIQILEESGFLQDYIETFLAIPDIEKQIHLLRQHRRQLLDSIHASQKRLDCLDYLIYKMKKERVDM